MAKPKKRKIIKDESKYYDRVVEIFQQCPREFNEQFGLELLRIALRRIMELKFRLNQ